MFSELIAYDGMVLSCALLLLSRTYMSSLFLVIVPVIILYQDIRHNTFWTFVVVRRVLIRFLFHSHCKSSHK